MNKFQSVPSARWNYSPVQSIKSALQRLEEAKAIGYNCEACGKILIEHIYIRDGKKYHSNCYFSEPKKCVNCTRIICEDETLCVICQNDAVNELRQNEL